MISYLNNKKILLGLGKVLLLVLVFIVLYKFREILLNVLSPFLISALLAYLLNPVVEFIEKRDIKRIISVILVYIILLFAILFLGFFVLPKLFRDISILVENFPQYSQQIQIFVKNFQDGYINSNLPQGLKDIIDDNIILIQTLVMSFLQKTADSLITFFSKIFNFILIPVITFYMLKDTEYFKNQLVLMIPKSKRTRIVHLFKDIDNVFGKYIRGQILISMFVGILTTILLIIIKVKYALILGIFSGFSNVIPYFGPIIGMIPTLVFALLDSPSKAMYAAGAYLFIQQIESGIIAPKVIGESVGIHPIYIILALLIGGKLFGVIGLIIAVPAAAVIKLCIKYILKNII